MNYMKNKHIQLLCIYLNKGFEKGLYNIEDAEKMLTAIQKLNIKLISDIEVKEPQEIKADE